jgi:hypothetical protein
MLQQLDLDVSKVGLVLHLFSSHLLLHRLSRSQQDIHTNEGWAMDAMGAGRGSYVRWAQARELPTDDAASGAGWALGGGGCVRHGLGARAQAHGDVGAPGGRSPVALVQPT